ncbi:RNI-like superfamily protein, partial [Tanacetum coccineum]
MRLACLIYGSREFYECLICEHILVGINFHYDNHGIQLCLHIQISTSNFRSIKLGEVLDEYIRAYRMPQSLLTHSCLSSLNGNGGAPSLRSLHLYNIKGMDNTALLASLSVCPSLIDLEIVCLYVDWKLTLESVSKHIPLIERLICESSSSDEHDSLEYSTCSKFILNCPNLTALALKGFEMPDCMARKLVKGFRKLKYVDFSNTYFLSGSFLKNLGTNGGGENLEVMILHDTTNLKQVSVEQFLEALLAGAWKSLRRLDISHTEGLASEHYATKRLNSTRCDGSFFAYKKVKLVDFIPIKQLLQQRPNFLLLAEFGKSDSESEVIRSDGSLSSQSGSDTFDGSRSPYRSTSDSSYISDQDSGMQSHAEVFAEEELAPEARRGN